MSKILLVDDNADTILVLKRILEAEGFTIITAQDGREGLAVAFDEIPDLILLDVMMPGMDGFQVCEMISNNPSTSNIPVILLTAKADTTDLREGFQVGAFDYIKKPFDRIDLLTRLKAALRFKKTQELLIEAEKMKTFAATVVTTHHEIKQPLTIISLSIAAIKRELKKPEFDTEKMNKKINYIEDAVKTIVSSLNRLHDIEKPRLTKYFSDIKMIDVESGDMEDNEGKKLDPAKGDE